MSRLRFGISMSLDGFIAGPEQSVENPLGIGGESLHDWVVVLHHWRATHGKEGGETGESNRVIEESSANVGATIMGRNMFGGGPGPWSSEQPWQGWWGKEPPFHHPVFVLTHHARAPLVKGETTFHFVTDGIESALQQAREAAGARDVWLGGGAGAAQQYLRAGLLDEMQIHLVPILLGGGERLFEGIGADLRGLVPVRTIAAPGVTHIKFVRS
jgi:dihydrofolate reductase